MDNEVDDSTVDTLVDAVTSRYDVVARYYKLKRRLLGLDELFDTTGTPHSHRRPDVPVV